MRRRTPTPLGLSLAVLAAGCLPAAQNSTAPLPEIRQNGAVKQLFVDGKPFIMLSGELHNSTASSVEYLRPVLDNLAALHLNTVISTVSWELTEPEEGRFDFSLVDSQINEARARNMRLVLIWFGTYKTAHSSYVPRWVKADRKRFPPMVLSEHPKHPPFIPLGGLEPGDGGIGALTPLGDETLKADAKAFRALMRHIKEFDPRHTVIMMQVENEPGCMGDSRDRSPLAEAAWSKPVPAELMDYLNRNKAALLPETKEIWGRNGSKPSGTWAEVFGDDEWADDIFMGYYAGRFTGDVAKAGKAELNLPMFVNGFLAIEGRFPGQYPSGGPVHRLLDIYHAAAPSLDVISPNLYAPDFKGVAALYARAGNPLLIPETGTNVGNLFWAIGHHAALGWSPFGALEDMKPDGQIGQAYQILSGIMPELTRWQAAGKAGAILVTDNDKPDVLSLGGYKISLAPPTRRQGGPPPAAQPAGAGPAAPGPARPSPNDTRPFAIVINTAPDEFLLIGANGAPKFTADSPGPANVAIASKEEGRYENGKWTRVRRLNGDEVTNGLPNTRIGLMKISLLRFE
ncbi:MAG TPA: DUF5597 domain-containing protein [Bryobacteraceae bacterium]|nr:DUF5597 domain-containing protein [Bryobacteraceae bacterium]